MDAQLRKEITAFYRNLQEFVENRGEGETDTACIHTLRSALYETLEYNNNAVAARVWMDEIKANLLILKNVYLFSPGCNDFVQYCENQIRLWEET